MIARADEHAATPVPATGDRLYAPADAAKLAPYREAGIDRVLLEVPDRSRDEILAVLDRNAALIKA